MKNNHAHFKKYPLALLQPNKKLISMLKDKKISIINVNFRTRSVGAFFLLFKSWPAVVVHSNFQGVMITPLLQ